MEIEVNGMRRRYSVDEWTSWITEQRVGSLTVSEFCRQKGLSEKSFYGWRRKLSAKTVDPARNSDTSALIPVSVLSPSQVEITFPCGALLRVPSDASALQSILKALLEAGVGES